MYILQHIVPVNSPSYLEFKSLALILKSCPAFLGDSMHFTLEPHSHWMMVKCTTSHRSKLTPRVWHHCWAFESLNWQDTRGATDSWMEWSWKQQTYWSLDSESLSPQSQPLHCWGKSNKNNNWIMTKFCPGSMNIKSSNSHEERPLDLATQTSVLVYSAPLQPLSHICN